MGDTPGAVKRSKSGRAAKARRADADQASKPESRFFRPATLTRLRLVLTLATFAALAWYIHSRPPLDFSALRLRWGYFAAALGCLPLQLFLRASKWRTLLNGPAPGVTLLQSLRSYVGALALGMITPGRVGEFSRGLYLTEAAVQGWRGAGLVMVDNWIDSLAVLAWACPGWMIYFGLKGLFFGGCLLLAVSPIPLWLRLISKVASKLPSRRGFREWARNCLSAAETLSVRRLVGAYFFGLIAYGLEWLQFSLLLAFLVPVPVDPLRLAGLMALVTLANTFQVTLAGLGVREGMAMLLLGTQGVNSEPALMAAFLQSVLVLFLPAVAGLAVRPIGLTAKPDIGA